MGLRLLPRFMLAKGWNLGFWWKTQGPDPKSWSLVGGVTYQLKLTLTQHCNPTACHAYMLNLFDFVFPNNKLSRLCPIELTFCFFSSAVVHSIITETVRAAVRSSGSVIKSFRSQYCNTKLLLVFSTDPLHQSSSTVPLDQSPSLRLERCAR